MWLEPIIIIVIEITFSKFFFCFFKLKYIWFHISQRIFSRTLLVWWQRKQDAIRYQQIVGKCLCKQSKCHTQNDTRNIIYRSIQSVCEQQQQFNIFSFLWAASFCTARVNTNRQQSNTTIRAHYHSPLVVVFVVDGPKEWQAGRSVPVASEGEKKMTQHWFG